MEVTRDPNAVFISYRGVGNELVRKFVSMLDDRGIPHRDSESEFIQDELTDFEEKIGSANIIVIFYSHRYFESEHCMNEYANVRKYENKERKSATYYVKCDEYRIDELLSFWGGQKAILENRKYESLKSINRRTLANGCYIDCNTSYCIQQLDVYFSDKIRYYESNLLGLADVIKDKYCELSHKNNTIDQDIVLSTAPSFKLPSQSDLVSRDSDVKKLYDIVSKNNFTNLFGFGGSGKTSLSYLFVDKYRNEYNQIAYVVVNNSIVTDFVSQINDTIHLFKPENDNYKGSDHLNQDKIPDVDTQNRPDRYKEIINYLESHYLSNKPNLLILDINNATDEELLKFGEDLVNNTLPLNKIYPNGWKYLIVSRTNLNKGLAQLNLNDNETDNTHFLKELFLKNVGDKYNDFSDNDFAELFKIIYYSPLIAEQLGIFLQNVPKKTVTQISEILHKDSFKKEKRTGITAQNRSNQEEKTIIGFLKNLIVFDKLSVGEKILLKHFILWPTDYIQKDVIWHLLSATFKSEKNCFTKIWSILKRYLQKYTPNVINILLFVVLSFVPISLFSNPILQFALLGVGFLFCTGYSLKPFSTIFPKILFCAVVGTLMGIICLNFPSHKVLWAIISLFSPAILFLKEVIKYLFSKSYLYIIIDQDVFEGLLISLSKKGILLLNKEDDKMGCKLHSLLAESLREQIDIDSIDYSDYWDDIITCSKVQKEQFAPFAKCIGHSLCLFNNVIPYEVLYDIAGRLHNSSTANYAALLYKQIISKEKFVFLNSSKNFFARVHHNLANVQTYYLKESNFAETNYKKAIEIRESLPKINVDYQNDLAISYNRLAILKADYFKDYDASKGYFKKAIDICEKLPINNPSFIYTLLGSYNDFAVFQEIYLKDYNTAELYYKKAIEIGNELLPFNTELFANTYKNLALLQRDNLNDYSSSETNLKNAIEVFEQLSKDNTEYLYNLAHLYDTLGDLQYEQLHDYSSAEKSYNKTIEVSAKLPNDNLKSQNGLAWAYNSLAYTYDKQNKYEQAIDSINSAINISFCLKEKDTKYLIHWLGFRHSLAEIKFNNGKDIDDVRRILSDIKPIAEQYLTNHPDDNSAKSINQDIDDLLSKMEQQ